MVVSTSCGFLSLPTQSGINNNVAVVTDTYGTVDNEV